LCVPDPRNGFEPRLGGIRVEAQHHRVRTGAKRCGDVGVGGVVLAFDGDPLHAEADGDGEPFHAPARGIEQQAGLAADNGAVGDGAHEEEQAEKQPFAAHAVAVDTA